MELLTMSMISLATYVSPIGSSAATMRATMPKVTTPGPDRHTIFKTGGTLRRAESRSCQLLQKVSFSDIWPSPGSVSRAARAGLHQRCPKAAQRFDKALTPRPCTQTQKPAADANADLGKVIISCARKTG